MKKVALLFVAAFIMMPVYAQVRIMTEDPPSDYLPDCKYDSLRNYLDIEQIQAYVGQEFQVLPVKMCSLRGYDNIARAGKKLPGPLSKVDYKELCGKILRCTDAFKRVEHSVPFYYLELTDQQGKKYIYEYTRIESFFYFLVLGYQKKFEQTHAGKSYECKDTRVAHDHGTGESVVVKPGRSLKFEEVVFNMKEDKINYIFSDENGRMLCFDNEDLPHIDKKKVTVEVNIAEFAFLLTDDYPQYRTDKKVRDDIGKALYDTARTCAEPVKLLKRMVFACDKAESDGMCRFMYYNPNGTIPIVAFVIGKLKAGQKVEVGKEYVITRGTVAVDFIRENFGVEDDLSALCAGIFAFRDIEMEPAE